MLQILHMFSEAEPVWSPGDIIEALETSRSTGYRYIKTLQEAGLLTTVCNGYYSLGPRIIEMDLQIRLTDPLLLASHGVLEDLVDRIGHSAVLCTAYGDSVTVRGRDPRPGQPSEPVQPRTGAPPVPGGGIEGHLAYLPHHRLKAICARQAKEIENAGLGSTWGVFRKTLGEIKKDGYLLTKGEFNPGVYGVAAPVLTDQKTAVGSVAVAWDENRDVEVEQAVLAVKRAASTISKRLIQKQRVHEPEGSGTTEPAHPM